MDKLDPDYASYNTALEQNEEEDKRENLAKIHKILEDEFGREVKERQDQIEEIELQICKVRKLLHLLRYALIMSYYKKKELEYTTEEEAPNAECSAVPDKQNRIHPAVKKLLGKNYSNLDHLAVKDKRKSLPRINLKTSNSSAEENTPESKKPRLDPEAFKTPQIRKNLESSVEFVRNRKKTKNRIVVGNISKWMPSSEEDLLTHKWMVYVRGPKEKPDVSDFIEKVVFYLHPSYKPHDVVEVCESPFHLSRRGWGEFPVRVQIFFKVKFNKPIDVVHNIKLDKTYTGRQTLGNETLIDVFLYDDKPLNDAPSTSTEHDYCSENLPNNIIDHSYSLSPSHPVVPIIKKEKIHQDENNELIYGLNNYIETRKEIQVYDISQLINLKRKDIKFNNTKIIVFGKKIDGAVVTNFNKLIQVKNSKGEEVVNHRVSMPKNRFKNMGEALPYLFKRLPLYTDLANDGYYRKLYPFTAGSLKEFVSWNVGKRRSSEWSRARTIKRILFSEKIHGVEGWTTKTILMYGRSHLFTPFVSYGLFARESDEKNLLLSCFASSGPIVKTAYMKKEDDETINVDGDEEVANTPNKSSRIVIDISDPKTKLECAFIRQTALDSGVMLKPEEIDEEVKLNGAEAMILKAVKCMAEGLIRRAKSHRVCTKMFSSSSNAISREDVEIAINERPEMMNLLKISKARRNEFFA